MKKIGTYTIPKGAKAITAFVPERNFTHSFSTYPSTDIYYKDKNKNLLEIDRPPNAPLNEDVEITLYESDDIQGEISKGMWFDEVGKIPDKFRLLDKLYITPEDRFKKEWSEKHPPKTTKIDKDIEDLSYWIARSVMT